MSANLMMAPWVCLLYHGLARDAMTDRDWFAVPSQAFETHLDLIGERGYSGCSLAVALEAPSERQVAISFDDGVLGHFTQAFPALVRRGMTATFFVTTANVGRPGYVSWAQLREMKQAGMSIQSHTRTHPFLSELGERELRAELIGAKRDLDDALGQSTDMLALPGGDFPTPRLRSLIPEAGYTVVASSRWGQNRGQPAAPERRGSLVLRRCTVRGTPGPEYMQRVFAGDLWLGGRRWVREACLNGLRRSLGPSRYARWRGRFLRALAQPT